MSTPRIQALEAKLAHLEALREDVGSNKWYHELRDKYMHDLVAAYRSNTATDTFCPTCRTAHPISNIISAGLEPPMARASIQELHPRTRIHLGLPFESIGKRVGNQWVFEALP